MMFFPADRRFTPEEVRDFGLIPYAVYGGLVASYKLCEDDVVTHDAVDLPARLNAANAQQFQL